MIDARDFLDAVAGYTSSTPSGPMPSSDRPIKLGTIDPNWVPGGPAQVTFDGESVLSLKGYAWASSYNPVPGARVFLLPIGQSYLIGGRVNSSSGAGAHWISTFSEGNVASSSYWGPGLFSPDTASTDSTLVSNPTKDIIQFRDSGIYSVSVGVRFPAAMAAGGSPLPFVSIEIPNSTSTQVAYAKGPIQAGDSQGTASIPNAQMTAGQQMKIVVLQNTGATQTANWRISVTRIA